MCVGKIRCTVGLNCWARGVRCSARRGRGCVVEAFGKVLILGPTGKNANKLGFFSEPPPPVLLAVRPAAGLGHPLIPVLATDVVRVGRGSMEDSRTSTPWAELGGPLYVGWISFAACAFCFANGVPCLGLFHQCTRRVQRAMKFCCHDLTQYFVHVHTSPCWKVSERLLQ